MKPYRVKRGGKLIGSFLVLHEGRRVNLGTKDASEARRRAALVERGEWPPEGTDAAQAVKEALEGAPPVADPRPSTSEPMPAAPPPLESNPGNVGSDGKAAAGAPPPAPAAAVPPPPAAEAVNQAAAASVDQAAELEAEAKAALEAAGVDLSELQTKAPEVLGKLHIWLQGQALRVPIRVFKGSWPPFAGLGDDPEAASLRNLLGKLWAAKLAQLNLDVSKITPGWWLLILSGVTAFAQTAAMLEAMKPEPEAQPKPAP